MELEWTALRASELTRQLMSFSRRQPVMPVVFDPEETVHDIQRMLRRVLPVDIERLFWDNGGNRLSEDDADALPRLEAYAGSVGDPNPSVRLGIADVKSKSEQRVGDLFSRVLPEDLLKFGLIPEFIGRMPVLAVVEDLDRPALVKILEEPRNALVRQYKKFFEMEDVELVFTDEALGAIADQALARGTGARGLRAIMEEVLLNVMYELPGRDDIGRVVVGEDTVVDQVDPELVPRDEDDERPSRAAS